MPAPVSDPARPADFADSADSAGLPDSAATTAVLLLQGLCGTPEELRPVRTMLLSLGFTVRSFSIPGYAFDPACSVQRATPFRSWIDCVEQEVKRLRATHARVMIVGISAGATLALAGAIRCGEAVGALVLMSTPLRIDGWAIPRTRFLMPLALYTPLGRFWQYRERPPYGVKNERVRAWIERQLASRKVSGAGSAVIGIGHLRENDRLVRHVRRRLDQVRCESVLALHAREDEVASVANLEILARGLRTRTLRMVVLDDCFHMITIDNLRHEVASETVQFASAFAEGRFANVQASQTT